MKKQIKRNPPTRLDTTYTDKSAFVVSDGYYQFSGWNKSDFNVTEDTTISGSWSNKKTDMSMGWTEGIISSRNWTSMCYGNGLYIIIAAGSNIYAYSNDGINWSEKTVSNTSRNWISICYGAGKFVMTQNNPDDVTTAAYSTDGINWTEVSSNVQLYWTSICYGNGKFVIVARGSSTFIYSADGITWTSTTSSIGNGSWSCVCYGNDKFVAVAQDTNYFAYSTDGMNWTEGTISSTSRRWNSVCYGNNRFITVAVGNNPVYFAYSINILPSGLVQIN